jgi:PAS domain S-box-containing protein
MSLKGDTYTRSGHRLVRVPKKQPLTNIRSENNMRANKFETFENLDNYLNHCSPSLHAVDGAGIITWANDTELKYLGYSEHEYLGKFIGDFHVDKDVVNDILGKLTRFETVNAYPARLKKKDGSIAYVMINSNVYKDKRGGFEHTRCHTTSIGKAAFDALKQ